MPPFSRIKFYSGMEGKYFCAGSWTGERGKREGASTRPSGLLSVSALCFPEQAGGGGNGKCIRVLAQYQPAPGSLPVIPIPFPQ